MTLANAILEWRKQIAEKLLIDGLSPSDIEERMSAAELLIFGDYTVDVSVQCPIKYSSELKKLLLDFSERNGCILAAFSRASTT